ncbi:hypothetical protein N4T77_16050 [Clostridium sp. CX1]|uniref:Small, acid-soluble spore protein gamma-type n=1 Tax=Clostridium tanneri TaxID=3037988 RepID=A0ABU4JS46_9CLOT|nr:MULTISPECIES: hypothetical protein [unclassified Clostridium]MCT8978104.1 hypothetical protein [Clostridium sp. CX1]MDW8800955.1 hypothetical protein [Clostridium sp. A1-XYC3]
MANKKSDPTTDAKMKSMDAEDNASREADNGYMQRGNPAGIAQKQRVLANNDNGSHM